MKPAGLLLLGLLAAWSVGCTALHPTPVSSPASSAPAFNVVLVSFDTLRAQETTVYGYSRDTTPNLKKFADSAVVFDDAIAPASWTLPATMSIFTGLYPSVHGLVNKLDLAPDGKVVESRLSSTVTTLPQILHRAGYVLGGFTGDAGVAGLFGFGRDFDAYLDDKRFGGFAHSMPAALAWVKAHQDRKFFLFLHGYDVHGQYVPPHGYRRTFVADYHGPLHGGKQEQAHFRELALQNQFKRASHEPYLSEKEFSTADARFYQGLYDEKIQRADARFAEFLKAMDGLGLTRKTIFVLLADHGDEFMEHHCLDHGHSLYQELVHVPLIIKIPGVAAHRFPDPVCSFDALPTVLDFLGIQAPHLDAVSLLPLMQGKPMQLPPVFSETDYRLFTHKRAYFQGRHVLIHSLDTGRWEFYDLKQDPGERHPLPVDGSAAALAMRKTLDDWVDGLPRHYSDYNTEGSRIMERLAASD